MEFYANIEKWLESLKKQKLLVFIYEPIQIREERIGEYDTETLKIIFEGLTVLFQPVGTLLIGAYGRIDIITNLSKTKLIYVPRTFQGMKVEVKILSGNPKPKEEVSKQEPPNLLSDKMGWKIVIPGVKNKYLDFDEIVLKQILREVF